QALSLKEISIAVGQMDLTTQQNAAMVDEATTASHALSQRATDLNKLIDHFDRAPTRRAPDDRVAA
ncbi:MAG TPA: hypothetical protein VIL72_10840, partial [Beijerinckiaceae bacterium]